MGRQFEDEYYQPLALPSWPWKRLALLGALSVLAWVPIVLLGYTLAGVVW